MVSGFSPGVQVLGLGDTWCFSSYGSPPGLPGSCQVGTAGRMGRPGMDGTALMHGPAPPPLPLVSCGSMVRQVRGLRWSVRFHGPPLWLLVLPFLCQVGFIGIVSPWVGMGSVIPVMCN